MNDSDDNLESKGRLLEGLSTAERHKRFAVFRESLLTVAQKIDQCHILCAGKKDTNEFM